jgi:vitamin B12 transporter
MTIAALLCLLSFVSSPSSALDSALAVDPRTVQVGSADRLDETLEQVANTVTVIGPEEIALRRQPFVADLLRTVPGVDVIQAGGPGGVTTVFIRGDDSSHTLVLLDGIPVNDASNTSRFYDFANMTTDNVERIEVLRGPQSVMYGSDAIGGVISIVTKKGTGPLKGSVSGEWGSYNTNIARAELNGSTKYVDYAFAGSRMATGSVPAAASDAGNAIRDPYRNATVSGSVGLKPSANFRLDLNARNSYSYYHLADTGGSGGDDPGYAGSFNETDLSAKGTLVSWGGKLTQTVVAGVSTTNRLFLDSDLSSVYVNSSQSNVSSVGQTTKMSYQFVARLASWNTLTAGVESREDRTHQSSTYGSPYNFPPSVTVIGNVDDYAKSGFAEELLKYDDRFLVSIGGRRDLDAAFGGANTYRISPTVLIPETSTKLKASAGTGFKAPSLYQLYSQYGFAGLQAERSQAWDAGFEQDVWERRVSFGATYFHSGVSNLIQFNNAANVYYNVGRAASEGYEVTAQAVPSKRVTVKANFTYTSAHDLDNNTELVRRPAIKFGGDVETHPVDQASFLIGATYTGPAQDTNFSTFPAAPVTLGGYALWHASGSYAVNKHLTFTARIDNMFNKRYEQVEGYGTLGIAGYGGVQLSF